TPRKRNIAASGRAKRGECLRRSSWCMTGSSLGGGQGDACLGFWLGVLAEALQVGNERHHLRSFAQAPNAILTQVFDNLLALRFGVRTRPRDGGRVVGHADGSKG